MTTKNQPHNTFTQLAENLNARSDGLPVLHKRMLEHESRNGSLFDGQLKVLHLMPGKAHGKADVADIATSLSGLCAAFDQPPGPDEVNYIARRIAAKTDGGRCFGDTDIIGGDQRDEYMLATITPGVDFTSAGVARGYGAQMDYAGVVFKEPLNDVNLHFDRVYYHELGHAVQRFIDTFEGEEPFPDASKEYQSFRGENYADAFMAAHMVARHGAKGAAYSRLIGALRTEGYCNGIADYYTTPLMLDTIEWAEAEHHKGTLQNMTTEQLGEAIYRRQMDFERNIIPPEKFTDLQYRARVLEDILAEKVEHPTAEQLAIVDQMFTLEEDTQQVVGAYCMQGDPAHLEAAYVTEQAAAIRGVARTEDEQRAMAQERETLALEDLEFYTAEDMSPEDIATAGLSPQGRVAAARALKNELAADMALAPPAQDLDVAL